MCMWLNRPNRDGLRPRWTGEGGGDGMEEACKFLEPKGDREQKEGAGSTRRVEAAQTGKTRRDAFSIKPRFGSHVDLHGRMMV